jgi:RNA polymerase sigma factor (sigma-70 family)
LSIQADKEFISALLNGDNTAWTEIGKCVESWLRAASRRHFIPEEDIQDLKQDILEKFLENNHERLQRFSFRCRLSSWMGSVVNNHLYDHYTSSIRRERREEGFESFKRNIFEQEKQSERLIEKIDSREMVEKALEQLTPTERRAIRMLYWDGLKPVDIARITGEKNTTITSRISRARGKLREVFLENDKGKGEKAI